MHPGSRRSCALVVACSCASLLGACLVVTPPAEPVGPAEPVAPAGEAAGGPPGGSPQGSDDLALRPHPPVSCTGSEDIVLDGVYIESAGNAVEILGSCDVLISNSHLAADDAAIYIAGSGDVRVENSVVEGGVAFRIQGTGDILVVGSRVIGGTEVSGTGDIRDGGHNTWE